MKAMAYERFGGPDVIQEMDLPEPEVGRNEVKIAVRYTSVNPVDWQIREGRLKDRIPHRFPIVPGWDVAGEIVAKGDQVTNLGVGDEVMAYTRKPVVHEGTYAEYVTVPGPTVALRPDHPAFGFAEAACLPLVGLTAWQALIEAGRLQRAQRVLIHGGAGGVGGMAIQLARYYGCRIYTTASAPNHPYVRELGADVAIDYTTDNVVDAVRADDAAGLDLVLDLFGGAAQEEAFQLLEPGGVLVSISGSPDAGRAARAQVRAAFVFVRPSGEQLRELGQLASAGELAPLAIEEFPLAQAAQAQRKSEAGHVRGKLVLAVS